MEIRVLQSLIDRNANEIRLWEDHRVYLKKALQTCEPYYKKDFAGHLSYSRKKIKKLVKIQVALKGEIAAMMSIMRIKNELKKWAAKRSV